MKRFSLVAVVVLAGLAQGQAQAPSSSPADGKGIPLAGSPIQKRAPDYAAWSVATVQIGAAHPAPADSPAGGSDEGKGKRAAAKGKKGSAKSSDADDGASAPAATPLSVTLFTKTPQVVHIEHGDARKQPGWEVWVTNNRQFAASPNGQTVSELAPSSNPELVNPLYFDSSKTDFPEFGWVSAKNFVGVEDVNGRSCLVFRETVDAPDNPGQGTVRRAMVDYYSRLPVALEIGGESQEYTFKPPPRAMLVLPENVTQAVQTLNAEKKKAERIPPKPY